MPRLGGVSFLNRICVGQAAHDYVNPVYALIPRLAVNESKIEVSLIFKAIPKQVQTKALISSSR
jgi:hypothetical protein